jgi:2-polyprenyl-6-hydroxyphenyl methylase/3-demethylubiquinone-9 3-methyltransferase
MKVDNEIDTGMRFEFGKNWIRFLSQINEIRIQQAMESLQIMLEVDTLVGKTFLDIGSGSGLFSLAARRLGAKVFSFDFDPQSVSCTSELKRKYFPEDKEWLVVEGSILDYEFLKNLGVFDIVYSWGVLHHTGSLWDAMKNTAKLVAPSGKLFIAIYNDQFIVSTYWGIVKRIYNKLPIFRYLLILIHAFYLVLPSLALRSLNNKKYDRGMSVWHDLVDWLGGYPFEVAQPEQIFEFYKFRGYTLKRLKTVGGKLGCNEYVFQRNL